MEAVRNIIYLTSVIWLTSISAQNSSEGPETTTQSFEFPSYETTETITETPSEVKIEEFSRGAESKVEEYSTNEEKEQFGIEEEPVVTFPENHKNFTPSQYLGSHEFPSYYHQLNPYQQQYKNYLEQKQIYNTKPIKFEDSTLNNFYLPSKPKSLGKNEVQNQAPFPYVYESGTEKPQNWYVKDYVLQPEKGSEQYWYSRGHVLEGEKEEPTNWHKGHWYTEKAHESEDWYTKEHPPGDTKVAQNWYGDGLEHPKSHILKDEHRGHQEYSLYHIYPHSFAHEEKFYHKDLVHSEHHDVKKENPWKKVFHALTALVPLGLLLASLTPTVIAINSTAATKTTRQRTIDSPQFDFKEEDIIRLMKKYGVESLSEAQCEDRVICELAREGSKSSSEPIEKGFWLLANKTPKDIAEKAGMKDLFKSIKTGDCDIYKCQSTIKKHRKSTFVKKLIRKHNSTE